MEILKSEYKETRVNKVNQGTYFKLKPTETAPVWVRDHYDKSSKTYACHKYNDSNHEKFLKGTRKIYIDFTYLCSYTVYINQVRAWEGTNI